MKKILFILSLVLLSLPSLNAYGMEFGNDDGNVRISLPILVNYMELKEDNGTGQAKIVDKSENYSNDYVSVSINKPIVTIPNNKVSEDAINSKINNIVNEFKNRIEKDSMRDNQFNKENGLPIRQYVVNVNNTVHYNKDNILSVILHLYSYTGGAHGSSTDIPLNIDTNTGNNGVIKDFLGNNENFDDIILKVIKDTVAKNPEMYFKESIDKLNKLPYNQKFYLIDGAIVVYFDEYEIAPYVAGSPSFTIPLSKFPKGLNKVDIREESPNISTKYIYENDEATIFNKYICLPFINSYSNSEKYESINNYLMTEILETISNIETCSNIKGITAYFSSFVKDKDTISISIMYVGNDSSSENVMNVTKDYIIDIGNNEVIKQ